MPANGCGTRPARTAPTTSRSACPRSRPSSPIATSRRSHVRCCLGTAAIRHRHPAAGGGVCLRRGRGTVAHLGGAQPVRPPRHGGTARCRPSPRARSRLGGVLRAADSRGTRSLRTSPPHRNTPAADGGVYEGALYEPLPPTLMGRVDILVANAPYVPTEAIGFMAPEARLHESPVALDGGRDGLDLVRRISAGAARWLAPGGHLLVETSERQATGAVATFARDGLIPRMVSSDELNATVVIGTRPESGPGGQDG